MAGPGTGAWLFAALLLLAARAWAAEPPVLPHARDARFLGVDTCGSSQCHGSREPWRNATVLMKERLIWEQQDRHATAWESLASEAGQAIARGLGIADATQAPACLACHATDVPEDRRGPAFRVGAGVGCESCHGPGGAFLRTHVQANSTHAGNLAAGLYPTTSAPARAALCLSCHRGDATRRLTHAAYGAGHPRLRFELDTYSALQPAHFRADADYRRRKPLASHLDLWASGQLEAARRLLDALGHAAPGAGPFPDFALHDCHGCHRAQAAGAGAGPRPGARAGQPALDDAPLVALQALARVIAPGQAGELAAATRDLQVAAPGAARAAVVGRLDVQVARLDDAWRGRAERPGDARAVAHALTDVAQAGHPLSFLGAEAVAMGVSTLVTADADAGRLDPATRARAQAAIDALYAALGDVRRYRPQDARDASAALARVILP